MTKNAELFAALGAPIEPHQIRTRDQKGRTLSYITARVVMNRLDSVIGPESWSDDYVPFGQAGVKCILTVVLPDGATITKTGLGGISEMNDCSDSEKSGESDALKRAAVKFGIGRELYGDGVADFVQQRYPAETGRQDRQQPEPGRRGSSQWGGRDGQQRQQQGAEAGGGGVPRTGKALFAHCKKIEQDRGIGILRWANGWAKLQEFPGRMVDWDLDQVALAYAEICRKLQSLETADAYEDALSN